MKKKDRESLLAVVVAAIIMLIAVAAGSLARGCYDVYAAECSHRKDPSKSSMYRRNALAQSFIELVEHAQELSDEVQIILERTVICPVQFRDIDGHSIGKNASGEWELSADQDVLFWLDLPEDIDQLNGTIRSNYPYRVKAGEHGTVDIEVASQTNNKVYRGSIDFVAVDDLTLGCVCNGSNRNNASVRISNSALVDFNWMMPGKHAFVCYPLYTSCEGKYYPYRVYSGVVSFGYMVHYEISPINGPVLLCDGTHNPDGDMRLEWEARMQKTVGTLRESYQAMLQKTCEVSQDGSQTPAGPDDGGQFGRLYDFNSAAGPATHGMPDDF